MKLLLFSLLVFTSFLVLGNLIAKEVSFEKGLQIEQLEFAKEVSFEKGLQMEQIKPLEFVQELQLLQNSNNSFTLFKGFAVVFLPKKQEVLASNVSYKRIWKARVLSSI